MISQSIIMLVLIWTTELQPITPALHFDSFPACVAAQAAVKLEVKRLNPEANVSVQCYAADEDPRG